MIAALVLSLLAVSAGYANGQNRSTSYETAQLESPTLTEDKQRALFTTGNAAETPFKLSINSLAGTSAVNNAAARQLKGDVAAYPFLATLPGPGSAVYITTLKPCGVVLPHVHPRATEQYLVISGQMRTGLAEDGTGRPNVTATVTPGQSFVAPQGLLHYNANNIGCTPLVFIQIFNNIDPGSVNIINGLNSLAAVDMPTLMAAGAGDVQRSSLGAFQLDTQCLSRCGLSTSGVNDITSLLSSEMQALTGLASGPAVAPAAASSG